MVGIGLSSDFYLAIQNLLKRVNLKVLFYRNYEAHLNILNSPDLEL